MGEAEAQTSAEVITLHGWLATWIDRLSDPAIRAADAALFGDDLVLRLCLGRYPVRPANAWAEFVLQRDGSPPAVVAAFGNGPRTRGRLDHVTEIPFAALLLCGELWQDSKEHLSEREGKAQCR